MDAEGSQGYSIRWDDQGKAFGGHLSSGGHWQFTGQGHMQSYPTQGSNLHLLTLGGGFFTTHLQQLLPGLNHRAFLLAQTVKNLPTMQETQVQSLGQEDPLEKGMATHSSILAWKIPWTEEPGGLQSMGSQRVGHS